MLLLLLLVARLCLTSSKWQILVLVGHSKRPLARRVRRKHHEVEVCHIRRLRAPIILNMFESSRGVQYVNSGNRCETPSEDPPDRTGAHSRHRTLQAGTTPPSLLIEPRDIARVGPPWTGDVENCLGFHPGYLARRKFLNLSQRWRDACSASRRMRHGMPHAGQHHQQQDASSSTALALSPCHHHLLLEAAWPSQRDDIRREAQSVQSRRQRGS